MGSPSPLPRPFPVLSRASPSNLRFFALTFRASMEIRPSKMFLPGSTFAISVVFQKNCVIFLDPGYAKVNNDNEVENVAYSDATNALEARKKDVGKDGWWLVFNDSTRDKDDTTVGVSHSRRYCNTGYHQSQGRRPSTLKCIASISRRRYRAPTIPSEINPPTGHSVRWEAAVGSGGMCNTGQTSLRQRPWSLIIHSLF